MRFILMIALTVSCLFFYMMPQAEAKDRTTVTKKPNQQILDIDNNGLKEIVRVDDKFDTEQNFTIVVMSQKKEEIDSFSAAGKFKKIELVDLSGDGSKQIAVQYKDTNDLYTVVIYKLKDNMLSRIFSVSSGYGVDTEFNSTLPRVKVGRAKFLGGSSYASDIPDWEIWVWIGDRFVKER